MCTVISPRFECKRSATVLYKVISLAPSITNHHLPNCTYLCLVIMFIKLHFLFSIKNSARFFNIILLKGTSHWRNSTLPLSIALAISSKHTHFNVKNQPPIRLHEYHSKSINVTIISQSTALSISQIIIGVIVHSQSGSHHASVQQIQRMWGEAQKNGIFGSHQMFVFISTRHRHIQIHTVPIQCIIRTSTHTRQLHNRLNLRFQLLFGSKYSLHRHLIIIIIHNKRTFGKSI